MTLPPSFRHALRHTRLITGLVMLAYVLCHFTNHALGLVSVAAMNAMLRVNTSFWMGPIGRPLLYVSLGIHFCMALHALFRRRSLRMSVPELAQLALGLSLPFLAAQHLSNTRVGNWAFGANLDFNWELYSYWTVSKLGGLVQEILMLSVWIHAMIGLHFRLKLKPWFPRVRFVLFALAILWPTLAMLGFIEGGREVSRLAQTAGWAEMVRAARVVPNHDQQQWLYNVRDGIWIGMACLLGSVLLARWLRTQMNMRHGMVRLTYPGNRIVNVPSSTSVLEASRMSGIRHASICGGRGRCSTCRVHVVGDASCVPPPSEQELQVLKRVGASPNVRLACQLRPSGAVTVTPLLPPTATIRDGLANAAAEAQGNEREIAILFADIRGFTRFAEHKLPYDVVFLLNRYFAEMGRAVELNGGYVDKFIGDGVMALFGLHTGIEQACRQAVDAAAAMSRRMVELNRAMAADLAEPLRIGIGIHSGMAIVGEMGFGRASSMTAIGDAVNTASRLESQCKDHGCELVVSEIVMERAGLCYDAYPRHEVEIRGRQNKIVVYAIDLASKLHEIEADAAAQPI